MAEPAQKPVTALTDWIQSQVRTRSPGTLLPTDQELARAWRLSGKTVGKVMQRFVAQGAIVRMRGKGTFIPEVKSEARLQQQGRKLSSAGNLRELIYRSLCSGQYRHGEALPSIKYMSQRFNVSPKTVIAAYRELVRSGHAAKIGKQYWFGALAKLTHLPAKKEVYLFLADEAQLVRVFQQSAMAAAYRRMEDVLTLSGFMVRYEYVVNLPELYRQWISRRKDPYGLIFHHLNSQRLTPLLPTLEKMCTCKNEHEYPVVVDWDDSHDRRLPKKTKLLVRPNIGTTVARHLALYLIEHEYRGASFFVDKATFYDNPASILAIYDFFRFRAELCRLNAAFRYRLAILEATHQEEAGSILDHVPRENVARPLSKYYPTAAETIVPETAFHANTREAFERHADSDVWVFQRDHHALAALQWAQRRRMRVPEDLSIISLENNPTYYHHGFSRCELDWEGVGYLLAHIVMGDFPIERTTRGFIKLNARMVEKLTTR